MSEEFLALLERVETDTRLQQRLSRAADTSAFVSIAKEAGFSITAEDITTDDGDPSELSDDELKNLAGGVRPNQVKGSSRRKLRTKMNIGRFKAKKNVDPLDNGGCWSRGNPCQGS